MNGGVRLAVAAGAVLWLADPGSAHWRIGPRWSGSTITMHLQQGSSGGTLIDGSSNWDVVNDAALRIWNPHLNGVQFRSVRDSTVGVASGNGLNNVIWGDDVFGEPFGSETLAVTSSWSFRSSNTYAESDVVFNRKFSWNSYRGARRNGSDGGRLHDLRRVALHEFGHVLGLDHPDEHGQSVTALMNSRVSDLDTIQTDDINGVRAIYGSTTPSNRPPTVSASCSPCTVETTRTTDLRATATDPDGDSLTYQWTAPQGTFSNSTAASTVWTAPGQTGNVTVTVRVQDSRGASATATVTLQVIPRDRLDSGSVLLPGHTLVSKNRRYRLAYQSDGNLVLYDDSNQSAPWATNTAGTAPSQAAMQRDGNFVGYNANGAPVFATHTSGNTGAYLIVQDDGNVVIYRPDGQPIWDRSRSSTLTLSRPQTSTTNER